MILKEGVQFTGIQPEMIIVIMVMDSIYARHLKELVITSITEGKHSQKSRHYSGFAVDGRTRYFTKETQVKIVKELKESLGSEYFVLLEPTHIHVEFWGKEK